MRERERFTDLPADVDDVGRRQVPARRQDAVERSAFEHLQHRVRLAVGGGAGVEDFDHVGMSHGGECAGFATEPFATLL